MTTAYEQLPPDRTQESVMSSATSITRRSVLASSAAISAASLASTHLAAAAGRDAIRPFRIHFPEEALVDLRRRIVATKWPDRETVTDHSQGVPLGTMQELARYWATAYD